MLLFHLRKRNLDIWKTKRKFTNLLPTWPIVCFLKEGKESLTIWRNGCIRAHRKVFSHQWDLNWACLFLSQLFLSLQWSLFSKYQTTTKAKTILDWFTWMTKVKIRRLCMYQILLKRQSITMVKNKRVKFDFDNLFNKILVYL